MARPRQRDFRYLLGYLDQASSPVVDNPTEKAFGFGCLATLAAIPLWGFASVSFLSWPGLLLAVPLGIATGAAVGALVKKRTKRLDPAIAARYKGWADSLAAFRDLKGKKKLHSWVDPVLLQILEAAAYHYARVTTILDGPTWLTSSGGRAQLRTQAKQAADEAMLDLMVLVQPSIGKPLKEKKDDIEGIFEDLFELDIAEALGGLQRMASSDWRDYAHQSPHAQAVFPSCRGLAERLKALADELEQMPAPSDQVDPATLPPTQSAASLDYLLGELKAVKEAEQELGEQHINQGR
jgi:hypothetical protein